LRCALTGERPADSAEGAALNSHGRKAVDPTSTNQRSAEGAALNSHGRKAVDPRSNNQRRAPKVRHCNIFSLAIDRRIDSWQENT